MLSQNQKPKLTRWFGQRLALVVALSIALPALAAAATKINLLIISLTVSVTWLAGLLFIRSQYVKLPRETDQTPDWVDRLRKPSDNSAPQEDPEHKTTNGPISPSPTIPGLEKVLERRIVDALNSNTVDLELEIPTDTELTILGQKWKVNKGKLTVKTKPTAEQNLNRVFDDKRRKRQA